jgi:hypothetical protein
MSSICCSIIVLRDDVVDTAPVSDVNENGTAIDFISILLSISKLYYAYTLTISVSEIHLELRRTASGGLAYIDVTTGSLVVPPNESFTMFTKLAIVDCEIS